MPQASPPSRPALDRHFFVRFGVVVVGLHLLIGALVLASYALGESERDRGERYERAQVAERTAPAGRVVTSPDELVAAVSAAPASEQAPASGAQVYERVCSACHATGVLDAPKAHDEKTWDELAAQAGGVDGLLESAIRGKNQMPPRGGMPTLSDDEIRAAIETMRRGT